MQLLKISLLAIEGEEVAVAEVEGEVVLLARLVGVGVEEVAALLQAARGVGPGTVHQLLRAEEAVHLHLVVLGVGLVFVHPALRVVGAVRAGTLQGGDLAAEEAVLFGLLPDEAVDEGVVARGVEIEIEHLRVYDALLGLHLLDRVDEIELGRVRLHFLGLLAPFAPVAAEEVEGRGRPEVLALEVFVGEGGVGVGVGEVDEVEPEGEVGLLGVAVAAVEVGVALVQADLGVLLHVEEQIAAGVGLLLVGLVGTVLGAYLLGLGEVAVLLLTEEPLQQVALIVASGVIPCIPIYFRCFLLHALQLFFLDLLDIGQLLRL